MAWPEGNWSKGDWKLQELPISNDGETEPSYRISADQTLFVIISPCSDGYLPGENKANAYLLRAAPKLYEALNSAPVIRLGETFEQFRDRYQRWHREVKVPAENLALGEAL